MSWRYKGGFIQEFFSPTSFGPSTLFSTGFNDNGELGTNSIIFRSSPVQVGSSTSWKQLPQSSYGQFKIALKNDGTVWSWGLNSSGQLGQNNAITRSSPVQVGTQNYWSTIGQGGLTSAAITNAGVLFTWGNNSYGQLGQNIDLNTASSKSSPVQIGFETTWASVNGGRYFFVAKKKNGTLWSWGFNGNGQLGDGTVAARSSPVQIGNQTNWSSVACGDAHVIAIKTDGSLWSWGYNVNGQLGQGDIVYKSSPVQVGNLTTWLKVAAGEVHSVAIKTDGTLWAWGYNGAGPLGTNNTVQYSSPVQVGNLTSWASVACGRQHTAALQTDGTWWTWGRNDYGQLGDNTAYGANKSSPIQVGGLQSWSIVSAVFDTTFACR